MTVYLASPATQLQADHVNGMPVLLSFALYSPWLDRYQQSFDRLLIDSGAYSELNSGHKVDGEAYRDWAQRWSRADAVAGLDDIRGNWKRSLKNYEKFGGFPTFHDSDPHELLEDLITLSRERGNWLGVGLLPPREGKENFLRKTLDRIPKDIHVHGWALRRYTHLSRLNSVDSTNWWRDAMKLRAMPLLSHLTYGETLEIMVKRYQRWTRVIEEAGTKAEGELL